MKFMSVREFRSRTGQVRQMIKEGDDLVLTSAGRPVALVSPVNPDTLEEELMALRQARARAALEHLHVKSRASGKDKLSMREIDAIIADVRRKKPRT
ncbi:MAG: type II toxin-antitoxin system Phd/YefM family antitoxin [Kiritimatiellae bacterium]|nr:type II toxin-antitoxin system Phd/YefM family antitoxin [Kiritimatiellia bacterium]